MRALHPQPSIVAFLAVLTVASCAQRPQRGPDPDSGGRVVEASTPLQSNLPGYTGATKAGTTWTNSIGMEFAYIPAGDFLMGAPDYASYGRGWEKEMSAPVRKVRLTQPFLMLTTEITREHWKRVMKGQTEFKRSDTLPIQGIVYDDAIQFCQKLSRMTGQQYRLPTEAEWEYACRAGSTSAFFWGHQLGAGHCNAYNHSKWGGEGSNYEALMELGLLEYHSSPAKTFHPNAWGLYDMHGNVEEWTADVFGYLTAESATDPSGPRPAGHHGRVVRGGSYNSREGTCNAFIRYGNFGLSGGGAFEPEGFVNTSPIGFRIVIDTLD